jgi:hypothetical protein
MLELDSTTCHWYLAYGVSDILAKQRRSTEPDVYGVGQAQFAH